MQTILIVGNSMMAQIKNRKFPKKNPTLSDALKFAAFKLNALTLGSSNKAMAALEQLNRTVSRFLC